MIKKQKVIIAIGFLLIIGVTIILGYYLIQLLRFFGWFYDGDLDLDRVGIGGYFEYDKKEELISISTFTGKSEYLYKYYYCDNYARTGNCLKHSTNRVQLMEYVEKELKRKCKNLNGLNREVLFEFVDNIIIYENGSIEIKYKSRK